MSPPEQWRFQWPDGTWIRWNPDTETWEKEISGAEGEEPRAETFDVAPEERWLAVSEQASITLPDDATTVDEADGSQTISAEITIGPDVAISSESDAELDEDEDWDDADVALGPRRSAAHVISTEGEEPRSSLKPTIIAGAGVGLAVGIIVSMMLR